MDRNEILEKEKGNDGRSVFLFYDDMAGVYLAYGWSAYYTTMVTDPYMSYSEEMQMPVALLRRNHVLHLRQGMTKIEHTAKCFYHFQMKRPVGSDGYEKWENRIHNAHSIVNRKP